RRLHARDLIPGEEARLELAYPVPALGPRQHRVTRQTALDPALIKALVVETAEDRRQAAEGADQPKLRGEDCDQQTKPGFLGKREAFLGLALPVDERLTRREKMRDQVGEA